MKRFLFLGVLCLGACQAKSRRIVCPPVVAWDKTFMQGVGKELVAHPQTELPYYHELAQKALAQHRVDESCK